MISIRIFQLDKTFPSTNLELVESTRGATTTDFLVLTPTRGIEITRNGRGGEKNEEKWG